MVNNDDDDDGGGGCGGGVVVIMKMAMMIMNNDSDNDNDDDDNDYDDDGGDLLPALLWVPAVSPRAVMVTTGLDTLAHVQCTNQTSNLEHIYVVVFAFIVTKMHCDPFLVFNFTTLLSYLIFVTDTTDSVCVKKIARCKFLQI